MPSRPWIHPFLHETDPDVSIYCGSSLPPSDAKWKHLESELDWKFPKQYRKFVKYYGSASIEVKEAVWPRPEVGEAVPFWRAQYGFDVLGWDEACLEHTNLLCVHADFARANEGASDLMPFMREVCSSDYWCFDRKGRVVLWHHEEPDVPEVLEEDFDARLVAQTKALVEAKARLERDEEPEGLPSGPGADEERQADFVRRMARLLARAGLPPDANPSLTELLKLRELFGDE